MKKFLLLLRSHYSGEEMSKEDGDAVMKEWMAWYGKLKQENSLVDPGNPLTSVGKIMTQNDIIDGTVSSEYGWIGGYLIIQAADLDSAVKIAQGAPALKEACIEVREIHQIM